MNPVVGWLDVGERNGGMNEIVVQLGRFFKKVTRCTCVSNNIVIGDCDGV